MKCPVCGTVYRPTKRSKGSLEQANNDYKEETATMPSSSSLSPLLSTASSSPTCRRCKADLSDLFRLHDQAIWYHRQALHLLSQKRYPDAAMHNNQALALYYSNADFHALAGKLSALQGEFREAVSSWQQALKFDSQNAIARNCLQMLLVLGVNIGLVESREGITPRPSQLELYVKLSPYTAPEYLGFFSPAHVYQLVTALMNYL